MRAGILADEACVLLKKVQRLQGEVQQMSERTRYAIDSHLKKESIRILLGSADDTTFQAIKKMDETVETVLPVLQKISKDLEDPNYDWEPPLMIKYWGVYGHIAKAANFEKVCRDINNLEKNIRSLIKLIARSAAIRE